MQHWVCRQSDMPDNSMKLFNINKADVLVGRISGRLFACDNVCPHRGASLAMGELRGNNIYCYMHAYEYDAFSGKLVNIDSLKQQSNWRRQSEEWKRSDDLTLYPVLEQDGSIYVDLP